MELGTKTYDVDRKAASKFLKVSTRTLDRYITSGQISARKIRGRVLLSKGELYEFKKGQPVTSQSQEVSFDKIERHEDNAQFYKDLYNETLALLREREAKLEQTLYRVGQLESQITSHYPVKTFSPDPNEFYSVQLLKDNLAKTEKSVNELQKKLKKEKLNKVIISVVLYVLLALQPVFWYVLQFMYWE